ncbi:serine hydrolase [Flavobacteriaceae bacterium AH-315-B10]|nr:serine hydrolase [Flavobacteriaceae bacterium AH-315-B10]
MKHLSIFIFNLFLITLSFSQTDQRLEGIEKELNKILGETHAAGFAVAVVEKEKIIYAKGFGYSDLGNKTLANANTLFAIGSSTKAFTSAILGQLRHDDKLSFDDSPIKYIPELEFYSDDMNNHIIIKDLMSHRTGLPRHDYSWYLFPTFDKDSLIQRIQYQEPFTGIRQQWYYNNFMFLVQGIIAERITGKSWEDNIRERFFKPLGMTRSNVTIDELEKSTNAAVGYQTEKDSSNTKMKYYKIAGMRPAGSINSSVNEMSNWLITWINKGKFNDKEILPEAYITEAMSSQMVIGAALPDKDIPDAHFANYGYGWMLMSYKGHYRVEHGGNIDGFSASVAFYPSDSLGIVVLANQNSSRVPGLVRNTIADRMLNVNKTNWTQRFLDAIEKAEKTEKEAKESKTSDKIENTKPSHIKQEYAGTYSHPGYGTFEINVERDSLFAQFKLMKIWLKHYHYDVFEPFEVKETGIDTTDSGPLRYNFITNNAGEISGMKSKIEPALTEPIEFKRKPNTIDVDIKTLEKYIGEFEMSGTIIKFYIKNEDILYLFVAGQPKYELLPTAKHKFALKILDGFKLEFFEDDKGAINEVLMIQPNGSFKAKRKE